MTLPAGNILRVIARRDVLFVLFVCFCPSRLGLGRGCSSTDPVESKDLLTRALGTGKTNHPLYFPIPHLRSYLHSRFQRPDGGRWYSRKITAQQRFCSGRLAVDPPTTPRVSLTLSIGMSFPPPACSVWQAEALHLRTKVGLARALQRG
jgi:hypothetical protein